VESGRWPQRDPRAVSSSITGMKNWSWNQGAGWHSARRNAAVDDGGESRQSLAGSWFIHQL